MNDTQSRLQAAQDLIAPWAKQLATPESNRLDAWIEPGDLVPLLTVLQAAHWGYLAAITGLDLASAPKPARTSATAAKAQAAGAGDFEVLYHVCAGAAVLSLRVHVPRQAPTVPSVCELLPHARVFERELSEMFGIAVAGAADAAHLFLPDDWPPDTYPLRKDFEMKT